MQNRTPTRSASFGRLYSVAGGAPNRQTVILCADVSWAIAPGVESGWRVMQAQRLSFTNGFSVVGDHATVRDLISDDLSAWREAHGHNRRHAVLISVETSQNPPLYELLRDFGREERDGDVLTNGYRLRAGDFALHEGDGTTASGAYAIGINWLIGWFNETADRSADPETLEPAPGRVTVTFSKFEDHTPPGVDREKIRSGLSATETLRAKSFAPGVDAGVAMDADETTAAAVMCGLLAVSKNPPPAEYQTAGAWGWDSDESDYRLPHVF